MSTVLLKIVSSFVGRLTWRSAQRLGALFGYLWYYLIPIRRGVVRANLEMALPSRTDHRRIARSAYCHFGTTLFELLRLPSMADDEILARVHPEGMNHFLTPFERGKGVIAITAHFGNFDFQAVSQSLSIPLAIVSRDLRATGVNRFWMETRRQRGLTIFPDKNGAKQILKWLRAGNVVGLTVDQRTSPTRGGLPLDFMGQTAWTTTAPAALALATGAALIPVHLVRRADGDHDLIVEKEIEVPTKRNSETTKKVTEKINKILKTWVLDTPEQWMWLHKRFGQY